MSGNGFQNSLTNDRPPSSTGSGEADLATDPASSGFFMNDYKKHDDLKVMLDTNKDSLKLEAMKRIIGMVAKGKDASDLFPAVVKNVVSKNLEVKKLVYVYLTRYAEEQQDVALLSISTFQRALKDPNQLIRASALRVLTSIRVHVIAPIMMLAIKEGVMDMSPYVRKTAAHAIPKLYSLDPEQKDQLIEVIEKLLADKTTLVIGSAIQAFEEVCPERIDLIHKNYRKLCNLLVDVEEWGQVVIINMLTRYCRSQFINPNREDVVEDADKPFYDDSDKENEAKDDDDQENEEKKSYIMDPDHRLLLRQSKPLLNSRNAAAVVAVGQLYHHCAPKSEVGVVAKALVRLLRGHKEVQYVVLSNIATMSIKRKGMFEPFLKSFYIRSNDPTHVKLLKLEILTNLGTETSISTVLREFQTYVTSSDKEFAAATIQAIGRCASSIPEITDTCLNGLVHLMSHRDEAVVAESVVVIKKLLQMRPTEHKDIIIHMAKMLDKITVPMARASILWLIGEYSERVPRIAPDVLRKMAKSFIAEEDIVKLQILNLAAKLCLTTPKLNVVKLLGQYVFNLAKYDQNYDLRDRSRFLRQLILPAEKGGELAKRAKKIFLAAKPAPVLESKFKDRDQYQLATMSHLLNTRAHGYQELPDWPEVAPDPSVRNVEVTMPWPEIKLTGKKKLQKRKSFYSSSESSDGDDSDKSSSDDDDDEDSSEEESRSDDDEEDDDDEDVSESISDDDEDEVLSSDDDEIHLAVPKKRHTVKKPVEKGDDPDEDDDDDSDEETDDSSSEEEESSDDEEEAESVEEEEMKAPVPVKKPPAKPSKLVKESKKHSSKAVAEKQPNKQEYNLLLDLDDLGPPMPSGAVGTVGTSTMAGGGGSGGSSMVMTAGDILTPTLASSDIPTPTSEKANPSSMLMMPTNISTRSYDLLNKMSGNGLTLSYKFARTISIFSPKMASIELVFTNVSDKPIKTIRVGEKKLQAGMDMQDFPEIATLGAGSTTACLMAVDFNDTTQPVKFELLVGEEHKYSLSFSAPVGEVVQPYTMSKTAFITEQSKLTGMDQNTGVADLPEENNNSKQICTCVYQIANVLQVPSAEDQVHRFTAKTLATGALVLITLKVSENGKTAITVNCEKMVIGSMLVKDLKMSLEKTQ